MKGHPIKTARTFLVSASDFNNFRSINFSFSKSTTDLHLIYDENKRERGRWFSAIDIIQRDVTRPWVKELTLFLANGGSQGIASVWRRDSCTGYRKQNVWNKDTSH